MKFLTIVVNSNTHCVGFWEEGIEMRNMRLEIESMGIIMTPKIFLILAEIYSTILHLSDARRLVIFYWGFRSVVHSFIIIARRLLVCDSLLQISVYCEEANDI